MHQGLIARKFGLKKCPSRLENKIEAGIGERRVLLETEISTVGVSGSWKR
jgi:hypothetical protein